MLGSIKKEVKFGSKIGSDGLRLVYLARFGPSTRAFMVWVNFVVYASSPFESSLALVALR